MTVRKLEIERFSVTSSKPIEKVVAALKAAVGERAVQKGLGRTELMIFMELDLGAILRREAGAMCQEWCASSSAIP